MLINTQLCVKFIDTRTTAQDTQNFMIKFNIFKFHYYDITVILKVEWMNFSFRTKKASAFLRQVDKRLPPIRQNEAKRNPDTEEISNAASRVAQENSRGRFFGETGNQLVCLTYQQYLQGILEKLDPRDQRIIIPFLQKHLYFSIKQHIRQFDEWLGEMNFAVASASFRLFTLKQLSYQQMKVYFSENLLLNLLLFLEQVNDAETYEAMKHINKRLEDNLVYLLSKYPQAKQIKPNKKLREAFSVLNNMQNDQNDMLLNCSVKFVKKKQKDYTPEIMKFLNYLVSITSQKCTYLGKQTTYFNAFSEIMQKIFESVEFPEQMLSQDELFELIVGYKYEQTQMQKKTTLEHKQTLNSKHDKQDKQDKQDKDNDSQELQIIHAQVKQSQVNAKKKRQSAHSIKRSVEYLDREQASNKMNQKQIAQYREKIKKYTYFKIGQKINPNTQTYTDTQINQGYFQVKSTAILRVLTKWIDELSSKIFRAKELIMDRSFRFKTNKSYKYFAKLNSSQKNDLFQSAQRKIAYLKDYLQSMIYECIQIEGSLAKSGQIENENMNIPKYEYIVGKFCSKIQSAASTYLVDYLNKIIQSLIQIPDEIQEQEGFKADKQYQKFTMKEIDLITFKISDLMRCKCSSKESQILRILSIIKRIGQQQQDIFKIVRIKDRLEFGTRDILINVNFMNKILCEIQLAVTDDFEEKQKMYDAFNHYLYELKRSELGPIMESACIWTHLDQRSKLYRKITPSFSNETKVGNIRKHVCQTSQMNPYKFAFVCSLCGVFYSTPVGLIANKKCMNCKKYYECNNCIEQKLNAKQLKQFLGLHSQQLIHFDSDFQQWNPVKNKQLPNFAIFIPKKNKQIIYMFVQKLTLKQKIYFIKTIEQKQPRSTKVLVKPITVFTLNGESAHHLKQLHKNFFVFEWQQKRHVNKTVKAPKQEQKLERQRRQREEAEQKRKRDREKIKEQVKARKKMLEQKRWKGLMAVEQQHSSQQNQDEQSQEQSRKHKKGKKKDKQGGKQNENNEQGVEEDRKKTGNILKMFLPNLNSQSRVSSRPGSASSKASKTKKIDEQTQQFVQVIAKLSQDNNCRVCTKKVKNNVYILVLGYYISESEIRSMLKQQITKKGLQEMILNKNEVLFLQQSAISEDMMKLPTELVQIKKGLSSVCEMYIDENRLYTLSFLVDFPKLRILHANHNYINSMQSLQELQNLTEVMLVNNDIAYIRGLKNKPKLISLFLGRNKISTLQDLDELPKLATLSLYSNYIGQIQRLENLTSLVDLDLSINAIAEIRNLDKLLQLQALNLSSNSITQVQNLDMLKKLKYLDLDRNQIAQIKGLSTLSNLRVLSLEKNKITNIQNLDSLPNLRELNLTKNKIAKLENLEQLKNLVVLKISQNRLENIEYDKIENLNNLQSLNISFNRFFQINKDICKFLTKLTELNITNNPFNKYSKQYREFKQNNKHLKIIGYILQ